MHGGVQDIPHYINKTCVLPIKMELQLYSQVVIPFFSLSKLTLFSVSMTRPSS